MHLGVGKNRKNKKQKIRRTEMTGQFRVRQCTALLMKHLSEDGHRPNYRSTTTHMVVGHCQPRAIWAKTTQNSPTSCPRFPGCAALPKSKRNHVRNTPNRLRTHVHTHHNSTITSVPRAHVRRGRTSAGRTQLTFGACVCVRVRWR